MNSGAPEAVAQAYYEAFNARDLDGCFSLLADDVEFLMDGVLVRGRAAARAHAARVTQHFPGLLVQVDSMVAASPEVLVVALRLVNPLHATAPTADTWRLDGPVSEVLCVRDGQITTLHSLAAAGPVDRTTHARMPTRAETSSLVEEQAALRRLATLIARGTSERDVLEAVTQEVGLVVAADVISVLRFEPGDTMTVVAARGAAEGLDVGTTRAIDAETREMRDVPSGPWTVGASDGGVGSTVKVPVVVGGRSWGVVVAAVVGSELLPSSAEGQIAGFAELLAIALTNLKAQEDLRRIADEQAALRRVAELVAGGAAPAVVLGAVAEEAATLLDGSDVQVVRFDAGEDGRTTIDSELRRPVMAPITVDGHPWGMLRVLPSTVPLPPGTEDSLVQFAGLAGTAIANAKSRALLTASRARVIATADETRRRLQRDVHDGAQQRLVQTVITLKLAQQAVRSGTGAAEELISESLLHAERATVELRDLVRGILPAALHRGGLRAGVESLVDDLPVPVTVRVDVPRLTAALETTAYFIVAEALTNVVKHSGATRAVVEAAVVEKTLQLEVRDDGAGGVDAARGSGITGLVDRIAASDGELAISSPPGEGTTLRARLPLNPG